MEQEAVLFRGVFADKRLDKRCEQVYPSIVDGGSAYCIGVYLTEQPC